MQKKILDVFLFYNELDLLKARLEYLGPTVDHFIISEANIDFSGAPKDFILNKELISALPYYEKIIYHREAIDLDSFEWRFKKLKYRHRRNKFLWKIQDAQRNATLKALRPFSPDDIIIFSDLDEFPSQYALNEGPRLIHNIENTKILFNAYSCDQIFFYYNIHNASPKEKFYGSVFTNLKSFRKFLPHKYRSDKNKLAHITDGGWHFSYFMNEEKILSKVNAISEVENLSQYKLLSKESIQEKILAGVDLYDRNIELSNKERLKLPETVLRALEKYLPYCV
jgi:beta-1,4-mannosyl-glycoprotein beta-1,4-N-acetylglucosaminyltransferase